ncbi:MAG TPA: OmpA family protein [Puia sp.]|jgi:outer membrane protein OmpA-like peptidoglycan-associated protein|nr:OmpA family protein [Puia sp.]
MIGKKYAVLAGFLLAFLSQSFAQDNTPESSSSYDIRDSSLIPSKRIPQHNEFLNNAYPFPALPRNQWEIGVNGGLSTISGDVRAVLPTWGWGIHVRKALGYTFSARLEYNNLEAKGLNWQPSYYGYAANPVISKYYDAAAHTPVFYNYKSKIQSLSLQGIANLNNIRFHRAKSNIAIYLLAGFGVMTYSTGYNLLDANGNPYNYNTIVSQFGSSGFTYSNRKAIRSALKNMMDNTYETAAQHDPSQSSIFGGTSLRPVAELGGGIEIKLNEKFNIAIEDKVSIVKTDLLDGQEWQETGSTTVNAMTRDDDLYNYLSVGLNFNIGRRAVEPLWWINPLDYAYGEINAPKHMKLPKPVLDDADGDGVTDQFDHEPNTPAGCPVDTHGVSRDTDGDGVPDCKDKELITPTQCQPVDADGVGKCPDPACCKEINARLDSGGLGGVGKGRCSIGDLPSIVFKGRSVTLSKDGQALASTIAEKMRNNPGCKVAVIGYGESSKSAQQLSWDRVNAVIKYLVEKEGVNSDRFIFRYGQAGGAENTIDIKDGTGEEGPNTVPAPHPNLRKR